MKSIKDKIKSIPAKPGVYYFYNNKNQVIYIGKAAVLRNRIQSYFTGAHDGKTEKLVSQINNLKYKTTDSVIEALIFEANEIKRLKPKYNIRDKDDKSFVEIVLTSENFPRFILRRPAQNTLNDYKVKKIFGPYTNPNAAKEILKIFRRVFGYRDCTQSKFNRHLNKKQPCLFYSIKLCPAPCVGYIDKTNYQKIIKNVMCFLRGKKKRVISILKKQMQIYSKNQEFESAAKVRNQIGFFAHINDVALIKEERPLEQLRSIPHRIETYDISNISGKFATGSMIVFTDGVMDKSQYRMFKILQISSSDDSKMMSQILERRLNHPEWPLPDLILLDGGKPQLSAIIRTISKPEILSQNERSHKMGKYLQREYKNKIHKIPIIALAKGPSRKGFQLFRNSLAKNIILDKRLLEHMRDEAHRFAINYHRKLRSKSQFST